MSTIFPEEKMTQDEKEPNDALKIQDKSLLASIPLRILIAAFLILCIFLFVSPKGTMKGIACHFSALGCVPMPDAGPDF
jgi:hypothetical protein